MKLFSIILFFSAILFMTCQENSKETILNKVNRSVDFVNIGKYSEAIKLSSEIIRQNPKVQLAYYCRGIAFLELGQYSQALRDFDSIVILQTINGGVLWKNPAFDRSDEGATQVPHNDVLYQRAITRAEIDSFHSAFSDFEYLIDANYIEKSNCLLWQGIILGKMGRLTKACEYFEKAKTSAFNDEDLKAASEALNSNCND